MPEPNTPAQCSDKPVLPPPLQPGMSAWVRSMVHAELKPHGVIQSALADEIGRDITDLQMLGAAQDAARVANGALNLGGQTTDEEAALIAAGKSQTLADLERRRGACGRALRGALDHYRRLAHGRGPDPIAEVLNRRFADEGRCEGYLADRFASGATTCPACGSPVTCHLVSRHCVECRCGRQTGIRHGTVAAGSKLPLTGWFAAIIALLIDPALPAAVVGELLGTARRRTAETIGAQIRAAIIDDRASTLLAGLDAVVLQALSPLRGEHLSLPPGQHEDIDTNDTDANVLPEHDLHDQRAAPPAAST